MGTLWRAVTEKFTMLGDSGRVIQTHASVPRRFKRNAVSIDVTVVGILASGEGTIIDLSEGGARIGGISLPERSRCEIQYQGQTVYGVVMWAEIDRIGVRFPYELVAGPLHDALEMARGIAAPSPDQIFRATRPGPFGRRGLN